jgi:hypothetical protein
MERARERHILRQRAQRQQRTVVRVARGTGEMDTAAMGAGTGGGHESDREDACYQIEGGIPLRPC